MADTAYFASLSAKSKALRLRLCLQAMPGGVEEARGVTAGRLRAYPLRFLAPHAADYDSFGFVGLRRPNPLGWTATGATLSGRRVDNPGTGRTRAFGVMGTGINKRELAFKALAGLAGGFVGWIPVELVSHGRRITQAESTLEVVATYVAMLILSALIGGFVNAAEEQTLQTTPAAVRRFVRGAVICGLLSLPVTYYSNLVFTKVLLAGGWNVNHPGSIGYLLVGRLLGWMLMGLMLGLGVGAAEFSLKSMVKGAAGGWVGGFIGGLAFDVLQMSTSGLVPRLIGFTAIGLAIGFFIGLVQELTKTAWLTVEAGRLRGRGFRLEGRLATVGRAEENVVGLFGDPAVQPRHAVIEKQGERYLLRSLAVQQGTLVNGTRVESAELHDGDKIAIGGYVLSFHMRAQPGSATGFAPAASRPAAAPPSAAPAPSSAAGAAPCLVDGQGRAFRLRDGAQFKVGRAADNDLVLSDPAVSRYHAVIVLDNGAATVRDLGSHNGTYLGERRVESVALKDGDVVRFGDTPFTFRA